MAMGRREGATAAGPLDPPVVVFAHGHPGPRHPSRQGGFPAAAPPRRGPAPQPAGGGRLGTVEGRRRALEPLFPPGSEPGAAPRRGHGDRGMGGDPARQGVQVAHSGRPTAHAIAAGVPPPPTDGFLFGPPTRLYEGRVEGHTEPHQGVANEPGSTVPTGAGARTAHGPHTRGPPRPAQGVGSHGAAQRRVAGPGAGAAAGALPADPHPTRGHVQPPRPPGVAAPRQGRPPRRRGGTVANAPQPVHRGRPLVPTPTPLPTTDSPGTPPGKPVPHTPGAPRRAGLPAASPARPLAGAGPGGATAGPPARHRHHGTTKGTRRRGWCRTGRRELRSCGLDGSLQAPRPRHHGAPAVQTNGPHGAGVRGHGRHHGSRGGVAGATDAPRPLPRHAAPPAGRNARADGTPHGRAGIRRRGGVASGRRGELRPPPRPGADCGKHTRATARCARPVACHTLRARPRLGCGRWHTSDRASARGGTGAADGRLPGHPTRPRWRVPVARPGRRPLDCLAQHRQARGIPTPAPGRLAAGAHPGLLYVGGPLAAGSPATHRQRPQQEAGTRVGQPPRTGVEPRPGGASTGRVAGRRHQGHRRPGPPRGANHARPPGGYPGVGQRGQQNPQWVVCMFSPADAHIVVCDPERLPGPEAVIRVADCTRMIVKALREGEHHALLLQVRLKDNARAASPGVWPAAAHPADLELQLAVPTTVYHWLQAFHDLRWRGKPDRRIGSTHWQTWLQADAQRDAILGSRARARDTSPRCGGPGPHTGATHGATGQPALRTSGGGRHSEVSAAPPSARGHGADAMPPVCRQVLHKRGNAGTPGVACGAGCSPGGRQGGGLQHPARESTEVPMARPVRPTPPTPGSRPRRRR